MEGNGKLIIDSILDDANTFAERTVKAAEKDAEAVLAAVKEEINSRNKQILSDAEQELSAKKQRIIAARRLDEKKRMLEQKQALVSQVIDAALEKITNLPDEEYLSVMEWMLVRAINETVVEKDVNCVIEVIVSPQDKQRMDAAFVDKVNRSLNALDIPALKQPIERMQKLIAGAMTGGDNSRLTESFVKKAQKQLQGVKLAVSDEQRDIGPGFILKAGDIEVNCTFAAIVRSDREALEELAARQLFS